MSQYVNIYMKTPDGEVINLANYSRNTPVYKYLDAPYEEVILFSSHDFFMAVDELKAEIKRIDAFIAVSEDRCSRIASYTGHTIEEKESAIMKCKNDIEENQGEQAYLQSLCGEMTFLGRLAANHKIYVGIEASKVAVQNIE